MTTASKYPSLFEFSICWTLPITGALTSNTSQLPSHILPAARTVVPWTVPLDQQETIPPLLSKAALHTSEGSSCNALPGSSSLVQRPIYSLVPSVPQTEAPLHPSSVTHTGHSAGSAEQKGALSLLVQHRADRFCNPSTFLSPRKAGFRGRNGAIICCRNSHLTACSVHIPMLANGMLKGVSCSEFFLPTQVGSLFLPSVPQALSPSKFSCPKKTGPALTMEFMAKWLCCVWRSRACW